jgi:hypothetical protein
MIIVITCTLPAVNNQWTFALPVCVFDFGVEVNERGSVQRYPFIWPGSEVELSNYSVLFTLKHLEYHLKVIFIVIHMN